MSKETEEYQERYRRAMHAVQSGVMMDICGELPTLAESLKRHLKHLRVGVNSAMIDSGALAKTLIDAGIIKEEDHFRNLAELAENEVKLYEARLSKQIGSKITLG